MYRQTEEKTWVYVIDDNFQIIYSNKEPKTPVPEIQFEQPCYQIIHQEESQCRKCPFREESQGKAVLFDHLQNEWANISVSRIEWPGAGNCHLVLCNSVGKKDNNIFCDTAEQSGHCEQLHNRENFFKYVDEKLKQSADDARWCVIAIDIEKFQIFNEWYGREAGDRLLADISVCLHNIQEQEGGAAGWFGDDDFAFFLSYDEKKIRLFFEAVKAQIKLHSGKMNILPAFGIYQITDTKESVYQMYDRAKLACSYGKKNYITRVKKFEPQMLESLQSDLFLLADIQNAFQKKEFTFVLQPKCNMENGKIVGAEALARWNNAEKGVISPGVFIPFLEKTGLVTELDTYIWEEVCRWQRFMLDRGRKTVPVSVNISRMDICSVDVPAYFKHLIQKYRLDPKLIELEITESVYAEELNMINQIVTELRNLGFRVFMDDFGSAYSSLNMLKDIEIDVIKMDMRFLHWNESNADRGTDILETVCNMAQILGLGIIAEGVETKAQKEALLNTGCIYGQGYLFYRPLAVSDFEKVIENPDVLGELYQGVGPAELFYLKDLMNKNLLSQNMLNQMLGAVAFYDVYQNQISVVRYNEQYAAILGNQTHSPETRMNFGEQLYKEEYEGIFQMFETAKKNRHLGSAMDVRRRRPDGTDMWLHLRVFFLYQRNGHAIFYSAVTDVSKVHESNTVLRFLNNDMPGGYYRHKNNPDGDFTHISQRFLDIFGFTREEIKEQFDDKFINMVHPDDREKVQYAMSAMEQTGGNYSQPCRMRSQNGYIPVHDQSRLVQYGSYEIFQGIILCDQAQYMWLNENIGSTEVVEKAATLMPCGVFCSEADGDHQFSYISSSMMHMLGYSRQDFEKKFNNSVENMVYEEDRVRVAKEISSQVQNGNFTACEFRVEMADGSLKWIYSQGRLTIDVNGKRWFYVCITDYDYLKEKYQIQEWQYLKYRSLLEIPGMLVYDYNPKSDRITLEISRKNGKREVVVAENYIENIEKHGFLSEECVEEQKKRLLEAIKYPVEAVTELKGRFIKDEDFQWYRFHYRSLSDENGKVYRLIGRGDNITEEMNEVSLWKQRAMKDPLTGLLNYESAKKYAADMLKKHQNGVLFLMDLDNFKYVNDTFGHLAGNKLLQDVAECIQTSFRSIDISARFGGDEFFVFMYGTFRQETLETKIRGFFDKISQISLEENMQLRCSMGVAAVTDDTKTFDVLFQQADDALYQSKRNGKNRYTFYK